MKELKETTKYCRVSGNLAKIWTMYLQIHYTNLLTITLEAIEHPTTCKIWGFHNCEDSGWGLLGCDTA
jgi:hypothetical protein